MSIKDMKFHPFSDKFVIVTERDHPDWMDSNGPMVMEQCLCASNAIQIATRAKGFGDRYGRVMICRLEAIGSIEEFEAEMERGRP